MFSKYGNPISVNNIEENLDHLSELEFLKDLLGEDSQYYYFISDALSYLTKFMIIDVERLGTSFRMYKERCKSEI